MMNSIHTESTFESAIIEHLTSNGCLEGNQSDFSRDLALDKKAILSFVQESQPGEWEKLKSYYKEKKLWGMQAQLSAAVVVRLKQRLQQ